MISGATVYQAFAATAARWPERPMLCITPSTARAYGGGEDADGGLIGDVVEQVGHLADGLTDAMGMFDIFSDPQDQTMCRADAPDPVAARFAGTSPGEIRYADMAAAVTLLSARYAEAGYGAGMRVGLLLENRPAFFLHFLALNKLGASALPINPDLRAAELEYLIGHAEPALIVALPDLHAALADAAHAAGVALQVIADGDALPRPRANAVVAEAKEGEAREAAVLYTSGTTGQPKGCVLANSYYLHCGRWYATTGGLCEIREDPEERMITPLPLFHMNAMACSFMAMIAVGGCLIALDRFHPSTWWKDVAESRATCLHYLGVMPTMLMGAAPSPDDRAHVARFGFGAGIDPKLHAPFEERFGIPLVEAWAMTETGNGAVIAANASDRRLVGVSCLGKPSDDVEVRILADDGTETDHGELLVRAAGADPRYGLFSHYYKNPEATAEAWEGGWFHTGDIVRRDAEGYVYFVDRKKNVIRRSGENIAAVEVESVLMRHPAIKAAGVAAVPDEVRGDEVFACLVVDAPSEALAEEIAVWCQSQMAYYKAPAYIAFVDALPLTGTQKIQRGELKALATRLMDDPATARLGKFKKRSAA